ncbi:hypothetical protein F4804DRAFT_317752 [Jackrogersella minutella]|nr:hypothetical protein F4804DRAFT_317752 [Jackrogersella minutella]
MDSLGTMSVSAIFEVSEQMGMATRIEGSLVLVEKARKLTKAGADIHIPRDTLTRASFISIIAPEDGSIACSIIKEYSAYIVALFENFD